MREYRQNNELNIGLNTDWFSRALSTSSTTEEMRPDQWNWISSVSVVLSVQSTQTRSFLNLHDVSSSEINMC